MPYHDERKFVSKPTGKEYQAWYSESGTYYEDSILDGYIESLLGVDLADAKEVEASFREKVLARALEQCGAMQLDGLLYTNLVDEFKRSGNPIGVFRKALDWGMEGATSVAEARGGFPRPQPQDRATANWARNVTTSATIFGPKLFQRITSGLQLLVKRLLNMVSRVIVPLLQLLNWWSFSAISVNTLPPSPLNLSLPKGQYPLEISSR